MKPKIIWEELGSGRAIAVSDIHGNLPYLEGVLEKVGLRPDDTLVVCGDIVEKGKQSLDTLRYLMRLSKRMRVLTLIGNCDGWHRGMDEPNRDHDEYMKHYLLSGSDGWGAGLLAQMCAEIGYPLTPELDMRDLRASLTRRFEPEFAFLRELPHVIETERCTFVHGGLPEGEPEDWTAWDCMKNDNFLRNGRSFDKWLVVGHTPVVLYGTDRVCANPIIDKERHIASIDGGCAIKDDGQLNALVIPESGGMSFVSYDSFPVRRAASAQAEGEKSAYFRWGDNAVRILIRGEEFTRCRHMRTGYEMDILTKYLYNIDGDRAWCNDCTDYVLPVRPGDELSVVEETSRGVFAKREGTSGWYYGELI